MTLAETGLRFLSPSHICEIRKRRENLSRGVSLAKQDNSLPPLFLAHHGVNGVNGDFCKTFIMNNLSIILIYSIKLNSFTKMVARPSGAIAGRDHS